MQPETCSPEVFMDQSYVVNIKLEPHLNALLVDK